MIITINGFTINDGTTNAWLKQVSGLELPKIRTSTGNYASKDGGWVGAQYFSSRDISIQGVIFSSSNAALAAARSALQNALINKSGPVTITDDAGNVYNLTANVLDVTMMYGPKLWSAPFKIELLAPDPILYLQGSDQTIDLTPLDPGGFDWPINWPIVYAGGSSPTSVVNPGAVNIYPTITLNGVMNNPVLTNQSSGLFVGLSIVTGASDKVVIDSKQHTITLNGANIYGDLTSGSTFWALAPGSNSITLATSNTNDTVTGSLAYQAGVMGI